MNQTPNFQLNQWESEDRILREDFNADNEKIDAALQTQSAAQQALSQTVATHTAALDTVGNCHILHQTYTGDGTNNRTFTFTYKPLLVLIRDGAYVTFLLPGQSQALSLGTNGTSYNIATVTWSGNSVSLSGDAFRYACNNSGGPYAMVALMSKNA